MKHEEYWAMVYISKTHPTTYSEKDKIGKWVNMNNTPYFTNLSILLQKIWTFPLFFVKISKPQTPPLPPCPPYKGGRVQLYPSCENFWNPKINKSLTTNVSDVTL